MLGLRFAIDLGTNNIRIFKEGKGIVLSEPSVVACDGFSGKVLAAGREAYDMTGRAPLSISVVSPMRDGTVSDFEKTKLMLEILLNRVLGTGVFKPNIIACVKSGTENIEKHTILDVLTELGAGKSHIMEEPLAAALGTGIDFSGIRGAMIADIGGGTSDSAVVTMKSIALSSGAKTAGNALTEAVRRYVYTEKDIEIGFLTAENIKRVIGSAMPMQTEVAIISKGKDGITGLPVSFEITSSEVYKAIKEPLEQTLTCIKEVLDRTPPELTADLAYNGLTITGGTAKMHQFGQYVASNIGIPTQIAPEPELAVIKGMGKALKEMEQFL
ncbi:MAG: rod shape-determining protein [Oscillospiraceae bacterium]|nr:rod shape-determining protein [Oscillospiraceae bacterium]